MPFSATFARSSTSDDILSPMKSGGGLRRRVGRGAHRERTFGLGRRFDRSSDPARPIRASCSRASRYPRGEASSRLRVSADLASNEQRPARPRCRPSPASVSARSRPRRRDPVAHPRAARAPRATSAPPPPTAPRASPRPDEPNATWDEKSGSTGLSAQLRTTDALRERLSRALFDVDPSLVDPEVVYKSQVHEARGAPTYNTLMRVETRRKASAVRLHL